MPLTSCPECRHVATVDDEQIGHRTRCPNCGQTFRAARQGISLRRIFRAGHPGGSAIGTLMALFGLGLGSWVMLVGEGLSRSGMRNGIFLDLAAGSLVIGALLVIRHIRAVASKPQAIGARSPLGTPGLEPGTKRL
jgi:predicted Zn finger-like uncharacterized protein